MNELALFAGAGGGILGGMLLGHTTVCAVEIEEYPRRVLLQRQRDGILPKFPIWDDVCTFDGKPWRGTVDVICGGFPCQDISAAGKGAGITGARSGLWKEYARIIDEVRPKYVFAENSPLLRTRGLGVVLEDLASMGYNARWGVLGARAVGAPHKRDRMWVLACSSLHGHSTAQKPESTTSGGDSGTSKQEQTVESSGLCASRANGGVAGAWWDKDPADVANSECNDHWGAYGFGWRNREQEEAKGDGVRENGDNPPECLLDRVANGVANRVDRLRAIGNGQVPSVARLAWETLICESEKEQEDDGYRRI